MEEGISNGGIAGGREGERAILINKVRYQPPPPQDSQDIKEEKENRAEAPSSKTSDFSSGIRSYNHLYFKANHRKYSELCTIRMR